MPNLKFSKENIASDFYSVRPEFVLLSWLFSITMAYLIELGVAKRLFSSRIGTLLHIVMGALNLVLPILWVRNFIKIIPSFDIIRIDIYFNFIF
jgi:hypothetical protein